MRRTVARSGGIVVALVIYAFYLLVKWGRKN